MCLGLSNEELKSFAPDRLKPSVTKATTLSVAVMFIFSGWSGEGGKCFLAVFRAFWILWLQALGIDWQYLCILSILVPCACRLWTSLTSMSAIHPRVHVSCQRCFGIFWSGGVRCFTKVRYLQPQAELQWGFKDLLEGRVKVI